MPALLALMDTERADIRMSIRTSTKDPVESYPMTEALYDLEQYNEASSLPTDFGKIAGLSTL